MQGQPVPVRERRQGLPQAPAGWSFMSASGGRCKSEDPIENLQPPYPTQCLNLTMSLLLCISGSPLFKCTTAAPDSGKQVPGVAPSLTSPGNLLAFPHLHKGPHEACLGLLPLSAQPRPYVLSGASVPFPGHLLSSLFLLAWSHAEST